MGGQSLPDGALVGLAGLLLGTRRGRALSMRLASLGGLALISGLAYRAYKNSRHDPSLPEPGSGSGKAIDPGVLDPSKATDADALLFIRAMVAAMSADGHIDEKERARITNGLVQAGIEGEAARWLDQEMARPATIEDLAAQASSPEKAAQVYAAARLAIEPDTIQEREFLGRLAETLKLAPQIKTDVDEGATGLKVSG
jgi:uncharacterized membrane protein YebE (DUF533 family)